MKISVSVIIPTYKRKHSLLRLLRSLKLHADNEYEVIIVEQEVSHKKSIQAFAKESGLVIHYHFLKHPSTPHARNHGIQKSSGDYLMFLDDDVVVETKLITNHLKNFHNPSVAATVGRVLTEGHTLEPNKRNIGRVSVFGTFTDGYSSTIRQEVDTVIGCNMCWRKDVLTTLGGFDERFTGNAMREEADMAARARNAGYTVIFDPTAVVRHIRATTGGARKTEGRIQWYTDFFSNETYFFLKHRPHVLLPVMLLVRWEWMLRCMFGFGREVSLRSLTTPMKGILNGIEKYHRFTYDHRN